MSAEQVTGNHKRALFRRPIPTSYIMKKMHSGKMSKEVLQRRITKFELSFQRHRNRSSTDLAREALEILKQCVEISKSSEDIEAQIINVTGRLQASVGSDIIVNNFCTRVLDMLDEELNKSVSFFNTGNVRRSQSLSVLELFAGSGVFESAMSQLQGLNNSLKVEMMRGIDEMLDELPVDGGPVVNWATDYIHNGDILLTVGDSELVCAFLKKAEKSRKFSVLVTEHAPTYDGLRMANKLTQLGVDCAVIPDSAVFAVMPRVTSVFCQVYAVFADGTLIAPSFMQSVMLAARHHSKPFIVLYSKHALTDRFLKVSDSFTTLRNPGDIVQMDDVVAKKATVLNPDVEVAPCNLATLFLNEEGPHDPADIFSLVQTMYHDAAE